MSELEFETHATLKHINTRKEGPEEDKIFTLDLKFTGAVTASD